jgi:hypothetical protein
MRTTWSDAGTWEERVEGLVSVLAVVPPAMKTCVEFHQSIPADRTVVLTSGVQLFAIVRGRSAVAADAGYETRTPLGKFGRRCSVRVWVPYRQYGRLEDRSRTYLPVVEHRNVVLSSRVGSSDSFLAVESGVLTAATKMTDI